VQNYDQLEDYKINDVVVPYSSSFALRSQVESKEREHMFLVSPNLLQDSIDKDSEHFKQGDYILVGDDMLQIWTCGHIVSHNIVYSYYFGNLVCPHVVQD
jgi:ABC-type molybdate transport system substrate-binding protein